MGFEKVLRCDGCKKIVEKDADTFNIKPSYVFKSESYTDAAGSRDYDTVTLYLCTRCIQEIKQTFKKILERIK